MKVLAVLAIAACTTTSHEIEPQIILPDASPPQTGTCADPEGPPHPFTTAAEVAELLPGRWQHCAGPVVRLNSDAAGIELTADGVYYMLSGDNLARESGFSGQGTWTATQTYGTNVEYDMTMDPGYHDFGSVTFEDSPRRVAFTLYDRDPAIYVLIP
jgi:hypothetical protein